MTVRRRPASTWGCVRSSGTKARPCPRVLAANEVAAVVLFMLTRPRGMTIRDVVMMPTNFDL